MANGPQGLFGPTPAQVRQSMADERLQRAALLSQLPLGSGGAIAGQLFGQAAQNLLGVQDPRLREAQATQEVQREIESMGLQPGTRRFTDAVTQAFQRRGLGDMAVRANIVARQIERQDLQTEKLRQELRPVDTAATERRNFALLQNFGLDPNSSALMANNQDLVDEYVKAQLKGQNAPALVELARFVSDDPAEQRRLIRRWKEPAKGNTVNVGGERFKVPANFMVTPDGQSVVPIPGGPADPNVITEQLQTKQRAAEQRNVSEAQQALDEFNAAQTVTGIGSVKRLQAARQRVGKAFAQLRNPPTAEASQQAAEGIENTLGGIGSAVFGTNQEVIQQLQREVDAKRSGEPQSADSAAIQQLQLQFPGAKITRIR